MLVALSSVKGVKRVTSLGKKEAGAYDFNIVPEDGEDIRAAVFKRVAERGKTLLSLSSNDISLEQIFLRLTEAADNDEARRMLGLDKMDEEVAEETPSIEIEIVEATDDKEGEE